MKWSLHSVILGGSPSLEDQLDIARRAGYDGLDVDINGLHRRAQETSLAAVRDLFAGYGVAPAGSGLPVNWLAPADEFAAQLKALPPLARTMADLSCPRTFTWVSPTTDRDVAEFRAFAVDRFSAIAKVLADAGVRLGLEWIGPQTCRKSGTPFLWKMSHALGLIDDIGLDNVGLLVDSWHWYMAEDTLQELAALRPEQIVHCHFEDAPDRPLAEQMDMEREVPGRGIMPLVEFCRTLRDIGYKDYLAVEVFGAGLRDLPPLEAALVCKRGVDAIMAKV